MRRRLFFRHISMVIVSLIVSLVVTGLVNSGRVQASKKGKPDHTEGALTALDANGKPLSTCPLRHTSVKAEISGFMSRVVVTQEFENPFPDKIEAVYTFPLPQAAAVDDMTIIIGDRIVRGKIMTREEARATYDAARSSGKVAGLLDQERPNIFTQSVANIMPGQPIKVTISYVETLKYEEGSYEFTFPMFVGERYIPATTKVKPATNDIPAETEREPEASRISPPRMPKGMRAGHDVSIEIAIDAGVPINSLVSPSHEIIVQRTNERRALVTLTDQSVIPNKDFTLKYDVAGQRIEDALMTHRLAKGGFFTLILQPPDRVTVEDVMPKELVFVLDTSGSMSGFPLNKARACVKLALDNLYPQDTFNVITFSGDEHILFDEPMPATPENVRMAKKFLDDREGGGGTEMMKAIKAALDPADLQGHVRIVCFFTDGHVGNDREIIAEVKNHPNARVFAIGFSPGPNRFLLDKMTEYGLGEVDYVTEDDTDAKDVVRRFHERIRNPLLTNLTIEWVGLPVVDVYPQRIPDLFTAKPVILTGRFTGSGRGSVLLKGKMSGRDFVREIPIELPDQNSENGVLATLWARRRIDDLMGHDYAGLQNDTVPEDLRNAITQLGLEYKLMTQFTSFVAVEETPTTDTSVPRRVDVPVENTAQPVIASDTSSLSATLTPAQISAMMTSGVTANVNVTAEAPQINTSNASSTTTVSTFPMDGRRLSTLIMLAPGIVGTGSNQVGNVNQGQASSNGNRGRSNNYQIDGADANVSLPSVEQSIGQGAAGAPPLQALPGGSDNLVSSQATSEVSITTRSFSAEFGASTGAIISVVTKSGTNEFHGSLFEYFGNNALDANDWFANSLGIKRPPHRQNDFGGTFGGPIKRDSAFFFFSYEGWRVRQPLVGLSDVPSMDARRFGPASLQPLLNSYPLPNGNARPDDFAEFAAGYANPGRLDSASFRVDDNINPNLNVIARYNFASSAAEERGAGPYSLNTLNNSKSITQTFTAKANYVMSPSVVVELNGNYSRFTTRSSYRLDGFGGAVVSSNSGLLPGIFSINGGSQVVNLNGRNAALATSEPLTGVQRQFGLTGALSAISGAHSLKFGMEYRRLSPILGVQPIEQSVLFNGVTEALTGTASRQSLFLRNGPQRPVFDYVSLYAQDTWRMTPRLTLTYGVRWDLNKPPSEENGRAALALSDVNDLSQLGLAPAGKPLWRTTYYNFAPRVGIAYEVSQTNGRELVVRGGIGMAYDSASSQTGYAFTDSYPFLSGQSVFNAPLPRGSTLVAAPDGVPFVGFDPNLKLPYTLNWSFSVEQALGSNQYLSAAYIGSSGRRLLQTQTFFDTSADFSYLRLTTNGASSAYRALQLQFNRRLSRGLQAMVAYTWSKSLDDQSEDSLARTLLRSDDPGQERGASDYDVRHMLNGVISYELPSPFSTGFGQTVLRNWAIDSIFNLRSGRPVNVVYSVPTIYGFAYLRPDLIEGAPLYLLDTTAGGARRINAAAFVIPNSTRQGTLARNSLRGFPFYQFDFGLRRTFAFNDRVSLQLKMEALNLFNHPNFDDPIGTDTSLGGSLSNGGLFVPNATFGRSSSLYGRSLWNMPGSSMSSSFAGGPRTLQFSLKMTF